MVRLSFLCLLLLAPRAFAQEAADPKERNHLVLKELLEKAEEEYRSSFRRPVKTHEFWAAMRYEIDVGKFDLASLHLRLLLERQPPDETDKDLIAIERVEGLDAFLRLRTIKKWSEHPPFQDEAVKNVELLIQRVTAGLEKYLSDPDRIKKFIDALDARTPQERAFAFIELQRSRERVVPYMVEALRMNRGKALHERIVDALVKLERDVAPPLLEILKPADSKDVMETDLRLTVLKIMDRRSDARCVPYLWNLAGSDKVPPIVQDSARKVLAGFLGVDVSQLPPSKIMLVQLAERYYQHQARFDTTGIKFWAWDGSRLPVTPTIKTPREIEEFFGLRYAREALDIDPAYKPAQIAFLNLLLERTFDRKLDKFFLEPMPGSIQNLLATVDTDLLLVVLERALDENKIAVALPILTSLGQRGETRGALLNAAGTPRGVVRGLFYPERRIQFASAQALLRMPPTKIPVAAERTVDVLRRFVAADAVPRALIALCPVDAAAEARGVLKAAGFDAVVGRSVNDSIEKLKQAADIDLIVVHPKATSKDVAYFLGQARGDVDVGGLPLLLLASPENAATFNSLARRYKHVTVYDDALLMLPNELKTLAEGRIQDACGMLLSVGERKHLTRESLDSLWKMARGELPGYDVRSAMDAVWMAMQIEENSVLAIEFLGRMPGYATQQRLASVLLDPRYPKLQVTAAVELNRHIQKNGFHVQADQMGQLRTLYDQAMDNPSLRQQLAIVLGSQRPSPGVSGQRILRFVPDDPMAPKEAPKEAPAKDN